MKGVMAILIFFISINLSFADNNIFLDNKNIQEYQGHLGKWILLESNRSVSYFARKFSVSVKEVYRLNGISNYKNQNSSYIFIPYSQKYIEKLKSEGISRSTITCIENQFIWPIRNVVKITSVLGLRWGRFHPGVDMPATKGTPIYASMGGRVISTGYYGAYGLAIKIEHRNGFITRYAHNSAILVRVGDFVKKGQMIGLVGSTGNSTGHHLHFEIRCNDIPLDPLDFLPENKNLKPVHTLKNWK